MIGVGSQDNFEYTQNFLEHTGMSTTTMLWERTGKIWNINGVRVNSAMQLYSHDLTVQSDLLFFNDDGRGIMLNAARQEPWASPGRSSSTSS